MKFSEFFLEVCSTLKNQGWTTPEIITHAEILDIIYQEYNLALSEVVNAPQGNRQSQFFVEQNVRSRISTTCFQINKLKKSEL